jgi:hypothetical protein
MLSYFLRPVLFSLAFFTDPLCLSLSRTRDPFSFPLAANCSHLLSSVLSPLLYSPPVTISLPQTLDRVASPDSAPSLPSLLVTVRCRSPIRPWLPSFSPTVCLLSHVLRSSFIFCFTSKNRSSLFPFLVNLCRVLRRREKSDLLRRGGSILTNPDTVLTCCLVPYFPPLPFCLLFW